MQIKHLPSGLFPHFDSGFERRPLYPKCGESVIIGCRLNGPTKKINILLHWKSGSELMPVMECQDARCNDIEQWYYTFTIQLPDSLSTIEYWFTATDESESVVSQVYQFETLQEIVLSEPSKTLCQDNKVYAIYHTEKASYELKVEVNQNISIFFTSYLTVKVVDFQEFDEISYLLDNGYQVCVQSPFLLRIENRGQILAEYQPVFRLLVDQHGQAYQIEQSIQMAADAFYGFGEKFDGVNQKGKSPLSYVVEQYSNQQDKTYLPVPFFFTNKNLGFYQPGTWKTLFSLQGREETDWSEVNIISRCKREGTLYECSLLTGNPSEMIHKYTTVSGALTLPPKWSFGPWMSSNGWNTQKEALEQVSKMNELSIPATVMVLEAWSDEETFYLWNDAKYTPKADGGSFSYNDFTFSKEGKWPDPKEFTNTLKNNGLKLILWQIPVIKYEAGSHGEQLDLDTKYAMDHNLCVQNADGSPYRITELWFHNSLIPDFTNPETVKWWFDKRRYLITELGVSGFKTDGGEFLFDETASLFDGRTIEEAHNEYPNLYIGAYHEFMNKTLGQNHGVTFSRAGFTGAGKYPIHWAGDQISNFSELKGQLVAGLSIGLSGVPFWGFDIGGFAGQFPSSELYLRSSAFATFAPIMQFHSEPRYGQYYMTERNHWNNDRSPWNMAIANQDQTIIEVYRLFSNLRMNLLPYLWKEAKHSIETSRPMMAHLIYDYPEEPEVIDIEDEYMLGRDLLVAPVITEGAMGRKLWLPHGTWYDFWTGSKLLGGVRITYDCDLNKIPVFVREGTFLPLHMNQNLIMGSTGVEAAMSNRLDRYEVLCIQLYGCNEIIFKDDIGIDLKIDFKEENRKDDNRKDDNSKEENRNRKEENRKEDNSKEDNGKDDKGLDSSCLEFNTRNVSCSIEGTLPEHLILLPMADNRPSKFEVNMVPTVVTTKEVTVFGNQIQGYEIVSK